MGLPGKAIMKSERIEILSEVQRFSRLKLLATGLPLEVPLADQWPVDVGTDAEFRTAVSFIYKCWYEMWKSEIGFLSNRFGANNEIFSFRNLINDLRTSHQHSDNSECVERSKNWLLLTCGHPPSSVEDWGKCGSALLAKMTIALRVVNRRAQAAYRDEAVRSSWSAVDGLSAQRIVVLVATDLGLSYRPGALQHHIREVQKKFDRIHFSSANDLEKQAEGVAEAYLVAQLTPLPVHYRELLKDLGLTGKPNASVCLRLAHAVAEISALKGDGFTTLFRRVWHVLQSTAGSN